MPPVRWKVIIAVVLTSLTQKIIEANQFHDSMPMTSDGWRPIVGSSHRDAVEDEITLYKNPTHTDENSKPVKAQTPQPPPSSPPYQTITNIKAIASVAPNNININGPNKPHVIKVHQHSRPHYPFGLMPNHIFNGHGPHIPLTASGNKNSQIRRYPIVNKLQAINVKRPLKPVRGPAIAHSVKNEVYVPAPSAAIGTFSFFNQGPAPAKTQGGKHFQQQFATQFAIPGLSAPNDMLIQQLPVQTYLIQNRNPNQNENHFINHNDEFTRNLVPPPFQQEREKPKIFKQDQQLSAVHIEQATNNNNNPQLIVGKQKEITRHRPDNIIVQLPPPFVQSAQFLPNFSQQNSKNLGEVEVEVTKEKLQAFSIPPNYNPTENQFKQQFAFQSFNKPPEEQKYIFDSFSPSKISKQTFRKPTTESFSSFEEDVRDLPKRPISQAPSFPTYDVTEGKRPWQLFRSTPSIRTTPFPQPPQPPPRLPHKQIDYVFLPTPYTPDGAPTSPTQSEISSIYSKLNNRKRPNEDNNDQPIFNQDYYNLKEVSTHYPIIGQPDAPTLFSAPVGSGNMELSNEITTMKEEENPTDPQIYQPVDETEPTVQPPRFREWEGQTNRPTQRRRRPSQRTRTTTTTTTEEPPVLITEPQEVHRIHSSEEVYSSEVPRPQRRRKPVRTRTTEASVQEMIRSQSARPSGNNRVRYRNSYDASRLRTTASSENVEDMPSNHKLSEDVSYAGGIVVRPSEGIELENSFKQQQEVAVEPPVRYAQTRTKSSEINENHNEDNYPHVISYGKGHRSTEIEDNDQRTTEIQKETQTDNAVSEPQPKRRFRIPTTSTTEQQVIDSKHTPENEIEFDYSTERNNFETTKETITIHEVYSTALEKEKETTLATTTAPTTTTTTTEAPTVKANRTRGRPIKYDNKSRPRFSVKEYRQRLGQYSTTTTEVARVTSESPRIRFPNRSRKPIGIIIHDDEPTTERTKFTPKDPRHSASFIVTTTEAAAEKKMSTRVRQFGRHRSTTEQTTTTQKVSIKPNIFTNLRRPPPISLRTRIMNRYNRTNVQEQTTIKPNELQNNSENVDTVETTLTYNLALEPVTETNVNKVEDNESTNSDETNNDDVTNTELMKNDAFMQSQRVSDLTLASQKEYETPGLFKSVSGNTRIVPSYFTISTDDPILPIEAFFPNIIEKNSKHN